LSFLTDFLQWTEQYESPESYFRWAALSGVCTVIRDNMYNVWGNNDRLHCNMYVMFVGPPALGKKFPMQKIGGLIKHVNNTKIIEGSASIPAVIKMLGEYETGGKKGASCILYSEEFSSFHVKDQNTNELLTDLWDFHVVWERNLISWSASLKNVCMSLLTGSNEILLKEVFDSRAMFGGLLSRTILIMENQKRRRSALIRKQHLNGEVPKEDHTEAKLKAHLVNLARMRGDLPFEEAAMAEFEHWYLHQWDEENPRTQTGIEGRMKTHVKKVAMALAMCEYDLDQIVRKKHIEYAIELCTGLYRNYIVLASEAQASPTAHPAAILIRLLGTSPGYELSQRTILSRHLGLFNSEILEKAAGDLEAAGLALRVEDGNKISYRLTKQCVEAYSLTKNKAVVEKA
jgi:hypothetical protein